MSRENSWVIFALVFISLAAIACSKKGFLESHDFETTKMPKSSLEPQLPSALWDTIEELYKAEHGKAKPKGEGGAEKEAKKEAEPEKKEGKKEGEGGGEGGEGGGGKIAISNDTPTEYASLKVYLVEKTEGVLGGHSRALEFPLSGGDIDLKDFVSETRGSYYFMVELPEEMRGSNLHVYFVSESVGRKVGDQILGSGCNYYYEVSSYFKSAMGKNGFLVSTAEQRDVSALAGHYYFAAMGEKKLFVSHLGVRDSRYRALQCQRN